MQCFTKGKKLAAIGEWTIFPSTIQTMKKGKTVFLSLLLGTMMLVTGVSAAATEPSLNRAATNEAQDGIFGKKKKKKDCDCPGNKKNRRKVARARRKNRTAVIEIPRAVVSPARVG